MEISRTVAAYGFKADGRWDGAGQEILRNAWNEMREGLRPMHLAGIVSAPYSAVQWDRLTAKYSEINGEHPVDIAHDRVRFIYGPSEAASSELVEALPGYFVKIRDDVFQEAFRITETAERSRFAEQVGVLKVPRRGLCMDFCAAIYHDIPVARIVSRKVRKILEDLGADVAFRDVLNERTGKRLESHFQLIVNRRIPFHSQTRLGRDEQFVGGKRYPGTFERTIWDLKREEPYLNYGHLLMRRDIVDVEPRGKEFYFDRDLVKDVPLFLADQYLGPEYLLTDVQRPMIVSRPLCNAISAAKPTGWIYAHAYLVHQGDPVAWGGTMVFMQEKLISGTYRDWYHARRVALRAALGEADTRFYSCRVPLHMGGEANVYVFRNHIPGIVYATNDLIGIKAQQPSSLGHYELMLCMRDEQRADLAARLTARLAHYDLDHHFQPGQVFDLSSVVFTDSAITGVLFLAAELSNPMPEVRGLKAGLLLCIGITAEELTACRAGRKNEVIAALKQSGHYPYTDFTRSSVI